MSITSAACRPRSPSSRRRPSKNPRSTVGTVTEIYDYMRLLFARVGMPYSPATGLPIEAQQVQDMVDRVMAMPEGTRGYLLAPIVRDRKGEYRKEFLDLRKQGFQRVKVDGAVLRDRRGADARQEVPPRHRRGGRPDRGARGAGNAAGRQFPHRAGPGRRHRDSGNRADGGEGETPPEPERITFSREVRLPGLRLHHRRDRAAAVLVQRAVRRLPVLRRARGGAVLRREADGAGRGADALQRRHRALAQGQVARISCRRSRPSPSITSSTRTPSGRTCPRHVQAGVPVWLGRRGNPVPL